jgi:hypothetical protein
MSDPVPHTHAGHEHAGHAHEHAGDDHHDHEHAAAEVAPPTNDNLILDIGAETGALIVHAAAERDQAEVEISPAGGGQGRSHNIVRRREAASAGKTAA